MSDFGDRFTKAGAHLGGMSRDGREADDALGPDPNAGVIAEMRANRRVNARLASAQNGGVGRGGGGVDVSFATGRPRDPRFYWAQNNLPYDVRKPEELKRVRDFCRVIRMTHPLIASCIDVFSRYPITGMELACKDDHLTEWYSELFLDQLDYEEFLADVGVEHWTVGEAWPFGSFNDTLGVWEDDELLNPDDIDVIRSPFLKEPRYQMRLPETLRDILINRAPKWEYEVLIKSYPELAHFVGDQARMPVSNILLKQVKFKGDTFHPRGVPLLLRAFRAIVQEEMLNAAQDAIADRLYTPLILAKLGASATDLGTNEPWIPGPSDLDHFETALDAAMAADFRVLIHHFAVDLDHVFGRETMPDFSADFERLEGRELQVFGLSKTMLMGSDRGETYAGDAINRDLVSQLLTNYQRKLKRLMRERMLVVAEAQEHYDYEVRGGKRYPIMEEVWEVDEETGEGRIVEQPKLLVPDVHFKAMTLQDEKQMEQYVEALRASGVPISMKTRMRNIPIDLADDIERTRQEQVDLAVAAQETRKETYKALKARNLPIPEDLRQDFEPKAQDAPDSSAEEAGQVLPSIGVDQASPTTALVPVAEDYAAAPGQEEQSQDTSPGQPIIYRLPQNQIMQPGRTRPPESDEQRATMPKPAALIDKIAQRDDAGEYLFEDDEVEVDGEKQAIKRVAMREVGDDEEIAEGHRHLISGPGHVGMRRFAKVDRETPLPDSYAAVELPPEAADG